MKTLRFFFLMLGFAFIRPAFAQPANEVGCMSQFDYDNSGNSKVNAYLLAMINHFIYPHLTLNKPEEDPAVLALHADPEKFRQAYMKRIGHYFPKVETSTQLRTLTTISSKTAAAEPNVSFDFVAMSNGFGIDPEAMIISTPKYIIICFRGTDRVANKVPIVGNTIHQWGEWLQTDINAIQVSPPSNFGFRTGKVHAGFNSSLLYNPPGNISFLDSIVNVLNRRNVASKKLWITGHSLGSAMATLCAAYLKKAKNIEPFGIYVYASPHVGDANFVSQVNDMFPGGRFQRFDFIDDPITLLPAYFMRYQRAGIRNRYSRESGSSNYYYNTNENAGDQINIFFCLHHTNWYARAAYFEIIDQNPSLSSKLPTAPAKPTYACSGIDDLLVGGSINLGAALLGGSEDLEEGTYYIINGKSLKYLTAPSSMTDQNGAPAELNIMGSDQPLMKWIVKKVPNSLVGGYTIQLSRDRKYLDADLFHVNENGCKVQLWERSISPDKRNQEWYIQRLNSGRFRVKNVMNSSKLLHISSTRANNNGADVSLNSSLNQNNQEWYFVRVR